MFHREREEKEEVGGAVFFLHSYVSKNRSVTYV